MDTLRKIYFLLSPKERRASLFLMLQMFASSFVGTFGIALIFPFMSIILNPSLIERQKTIYFIYRFMNFDSTKKFLIFLGFFLLVTLLLGNVFTALSAYFSTNFSMARNHSFADKLLSRYLSQPYSFYLNKNSSVLMKNIMIEVSSVVSNILLGLMRLVEQLVMSFMILFLLLMVNPYLSLFVLLGLGGIYAVVYFLVRNKLSSISKKTVFLRDRMAKNLNEGFGGIKYIKFLNREKNIVDSYSQDAMDGAKQIAASIAIGTAPRSILETIAFGGLILFILSYLINDNDVAKIIPMISLYAFAGYRLMPSFQQIFYIAAQIKANKNSLDIVHNDIVYLPLLMKSLSDIKLPLNNNLLLHNVEFTYPLSEKSVIKKINLNIKANTTIGLVGETGAGKTTIIDIILGLLQPSSGSVIVDGVALNKDNVMNWQNNLGYVPQSIYLADDTIAKNIAFGLSHDEIDMEAVKKAAFCANLSEFIETQLQDKYDSFIGERGVRLSGGQMQRIGIARALYRDPQVLILDEATSSLDGITEDIILQSVKNIEHKKTIIMIAHRLATIKDCDQIFFIKSGVIIDFGTYDELIVKNYEFRRMAKQHI